VSGSLALVTSVEGGTLDVFDISDPDDPIEIGTLPIAGVPHDVVWNGTRAIVVGEPSMLWTIDLTDPTTPTLQGQTSLPRSGQFVAIRDGIAYVADSQGLTLVDISNSSAPDVIGSTPASVESARYISMNDERVFVAGADADFSGPPYYGGIWSYPLQCGVVAVADPAPGVSVSPSVRPNPFRAGAVISGVAIGPLRIFDVTGRLVRTLPGDEHRTPSTEVFWDGRDDAGRLVPGGHYFIRSGGSKALTIRALKLR
jgi:hypothetical protein